MWAMRAPNPTAGPGGDALHRRYKKTQTLVWAKTSLIVKGLLPRPAPSLDRAHYAHLAVIEFLYQGFVHVTVRDAARIY